LSINNCIDDLETYARVEREVRECTVRKQSLLIFGNTVAYFQGRVYLGGSTFQGSDLVEL
jgi:hypothetical protein